MPLNPMRTHHTQQCSRLPRQSSYVPPIPISRPDHRRRRVWRDDRARARDHRIQGPRTSHHDPRPHPHAARDRRRVVRLQQGTGKFIIPAERRLSGRNTLMGCTRASRTRPWRNGGPRTGGNITTSAASSLLFLLLQSKTTISPKPSPSTLSRGWRRRASRRVPFPIAATCRKCTPRPSRSATLPPRMSVSG